MVAIPRLSDLNVTSEDYLRAFYRLEEVEGRVSTTDLARELDVSAPAVSEMITKMAETGLVDHVKYKGARLSDEGRHLALMVTRRHRLWEVFLIEHLGFAWDEVHEHAHHLEHIGSAELVDRLDDFLGRPSHDPHGDPIPGRDGSLPSDDLHRLSTVRSGSTCIVRRVSDEHPEVLRYAASLGLSIGATLRISERIEFDGSLRLLVDGHERVVGEKLGGHIWVELSKKSAETTS